MGTKRFFTRAATFHIAEAVDAYAKGDELQLHRALSLRPWMWSPLDANNAEPPLWLVEMDDKRALEDWRRAKALAAELEALAG